MTCFVTVNRCFGSVIGSLNQWHQNNKTELFLKSWIQQCLRRCSYSFELKSTVCFPYFVGLTVNVESITFSCLQCHILQFRCAAFFTKLDATSLTQQVLLQLLETKWKNIHNNYLDLRAVSVCGQKRHTRHSPNSICARRWTTRLPTKMCTNAFPAHLQTWNFHCCWSATLGCECLRSEETHKLPAEIYQSPQFSGVRPWFRRRIKSQYSWFRCML